MFLFLLSCASHLASKKTNKQTNSQSTVVRKPRRDFRLQTSDFRLQTSDFRLQTSDFSRRTQNKWACELWCREPLVARVQLLCRRSQVTLGRLLVLPHVLPHGLSRKIETARSLEKEERAIKKRQRNVHDIWITILYTSQAFFSCEKPASENTKTRLFKLGKAAIFDALGLHVNCRSMEDTRVIIGKRTIFLAVFRQFRCQHRIWTL